MMLREVWAGKFDFKHTHHSARLPLIARSLLRASLPALQRKLAGSRSDISFFFGCLGGECGRRETAIARQSLPPT